MRQVSQLSLCAQTRKPRWLLLVVPPRPEAGLLQHADVVRVSQVPPIALSTLFPLFVS